MATNVWKFPISVLTKKCPIRTRIAIPISKLEKKKTKGKTGVFQRGILFTALKRNPV
jgi:hypothetical protein